MINDPFLRFYSFATIALSCFTGVLFAVPLAISNPNPLALLLLPFFGTMGGIAGYRRRNNRFFFYLSLISVVILTTIIYVNILKNEF